MSAFKHDNNTGRTSAGFNNQFKKQKTAGIPKSNYLIWVLPFDISTNLPDLTNPKLVAGCQTLSGLESRIEEKESNASESLITEKIAGRIYHTNLTLTRGFDQDNFIRQWYLQRGSSGVGSSSGISDRFVADIVIAKLKSDNVSVSRLILVKDAWLVMYKADDMDVNSTDPWFESIEIAHKGWAYGNWNNKGTSAEYGSLTNTLNQVLTMDSPVDYFYTKTGTTVSYSQVDAANFFLGDT